MNEPAAIPALARRVLTGINPSGKSVIISDGPIPKNASFEEVGVGCGGDFWITSRIPADLTDQDDPLAGYMLKQWPSPGEVIARIVTWLPGLEYPMHRSDTIDIMFVISGQVELLLDEESTVLRPGDTAVQRGTNHGWRVIGSEPCTFGGVLIDAVPQSRA